MDGGVLAMDGACRLWVERVGYGWGNVLWMDHVGCGWGKQAMDRRHGLWMGAVGYGWETWAVDWWE